MSQAITSGEFQKKFGHYRKQAQTTPLFIKLYGKEKLVFMSKDQYDNLLKAAAAGSGVDVAPDVPQDCANSQVSCAEEVGRPETPIYAGEIPESDLSELFSLLNETAD